MVISYSRFHCILFVLAAFFCTQLHAEEHGQYFYRDFWNPTYHVERLNYCTLNGKECGLAVANCYCRMMGYEKAVKEIKEHNVGLTRFLSSKIRCQGWQCNGFRLIRCVGKASHKPPEDYYYRSRRFVYPRLKNYRVNWCYEDEKGCGQRAAHSFCRLMGYTRAERFEKQEQVSATKAIGNQKLCFGKACNAFSYITCYR